jgi:hypothetical protein
MLYMPSVITIVERDMLHFLRVLNHRRVVVFAHPREQSDPEQRFGPLGIIKADCHEFLHFVVGMRGYSSGLPFSK